MAVPLTGNTPNTETSVNPAVLAGGQFGAIVGNADGQVGFFGSSGSVQIAGSSITTVGELVAALQAYGLLA